MLLQLQLIIDGIKPMENDDTKNDHTTIHQSRNVQHLLVLLTRSLCSSCRSVDSRFVATVSLLYFGFFFSGELSLGESPVPLNLSYPAT